MKLRRLSLITAAVTPLLFSHLAHGAAYQLYELGTPIVGTAGVGQAAVAEDASTVYFNPAGMTMLPSTQVMLGSELSLPYTNFSPNSSNTISGNNGGNAGVLSPALGGYFVYNASQNFKVGFGVTTPYAGALYYTNHWVGRYVVQQMELLTININPAIAYRAADWVSIGAGFSYEYASLYQTNALRLTSLLDGQAAVNLGNFAPGFNLGVLFTPQEATKIGIAYRTQIVHHLTGSVDFANISTTPTAQTRLVMPANFIASLSQDISDTFTLLGELGWANWSSMRNTVLTVDGYSAVTPLNWNDTFRIGFGGQFRALDPLILQAGLSYDSSPTTKSRRTPNLPMDRQIRLGAGIEYYMQPSVTLGLSYEYMNMGSAPIMETSSVGVLAGNYSRNYANFFQASLNVGM